MRAIFNALLEMLDEREQTLDNVIGKIKHNKKKIPEGRIRICLSNGRTQYYLINESSDKVGKYVKQKDMGTVYAIAQNEYNQRVLTAATREKQCINKFRKNIQSKQMEDIYSKIGKNRQPLITPVSMTDDEFVKRWMSVKYEGRYFRDGAPEFYSNKGERMRSKSEVIIANALHRHNIPYLYEFPIEIADIGTVYPDFRILNVRKRKVILWEHFGMMDDRDYRDDKVVEIEKYGMSGYFMGENLIVTMESGRKQLNVKYVELLINHYCL